MEKSIQNHLEGLLEHGVQRIPVGDKEDANPSMEITISMTFRDGPPSCTWKQLETHMDEQCSLVDLARWGYSCHYIPDSVKKGEDCNASEKIPERVDFVVHLLPIYDKH